MLQLQSALGVIAILALAFLLSENRRAVPWRPVLVGLAVTFGLALLVGLYLVSVGGLPILTIGVLSILSGIAYTGGTPTIPSHSTVI